MSEYLQLEGSSQEYLQLAGPSASVLDADMIFLNGAPLLCNNEPFLLRCLSVIGVNWFQLEGSPQEYYQLEGSSQAYAQLEGSSQEYLQLEG